MPDRIFYAAAEDQDTHKITGYVPSKFLMRNGAYVIDPVPGASQNANLYSDSLGSNQTDGRIANPNNYIVMPANYDEQQARDFAAGVAAVRKFGPQGAMLAQVASAFWPGGSEDLQRNPRWGIPPNSFVRAYTGGASNHFGYVTAAAGLPRELAEFGGGLHNLLSKSKNPNVDTNGWLGLSKVNQANIVQGYAAGLAADKASAPFNDYGYPAQPQRTPGQIGDGNGIAALPASLAGVNPDEPEPPTWPPQQNSPVRYLSSERVQY